MHDSCKHCHCDRMWDLVSRVSLAGEASRRRSAADDPKWQKVMRNAVSSSFRGTETERTGRNKSPGNKKKDVLVRNSED